MKYKTKAIEAQRKAILAPLHGAAQNGVTVPAGGEVRNIPVEGVQYPACGQLVKTQSGVVSRLEYMPEPRNLEQSFFGANGSPSNHAKESGSVAERWLPELTAEESKGLSAAEKVEAREAKRLAVMPGTWKRKYLPYGHRRELVNIVRGYPHLGQRWATFANGAEVES